MNHLIIYAHPNSASINYQLKETVINVAENAGHIVRVRDLYALHFNPVLSLKDIQDQRAGQPDATITEEQRHIQWADMITFIYPVWWTGMPAIMKGYIDRVMTYGFAYRYTNGIQQGLLKGKMAFVINTQGKSHREYQAIGMDQALKLTSDTGVYTYCGFEVKQHLFLEQADRATGEVISNWLQQIASAYQDIA